MSSRAAASIPTLAARRLTGEAARRLRRARGGGRVHSVFAHTVNLELTGLADAGWLSLHRASPIPAPFGIACPALEVAPDLAGTLVRVEPDALVFGDRLRVALECAAVVDTAVPAAAPMPPVADCLARARRDATGGLLPVAAALLRRGSTPDGALARLTGPALRDLVVATSARDVGAIGAAARRLVGLGPGLTPAGDDCLVGWLLAAWTGRAGGPGLVEAAAPSLLTAAAERTGALSRAFLAAAADGQAAEPVHRFITRPNPANLAAVLALGASSGRDLLAGYFLGRVALAAPSPRAPQRRLGAGVE